MFISLLRHGIAEDTAATDYDRALTRAGREQAERIVDVLAALGWAPGSILHSPYVRTAETAEIVHSRFPGVQRVAIDALATGAIDGILQACTRHPHPLLVGHEPTMGNLTGRLIGAPMGAIRFERMTLAILDVDRLPTTRPARLVAYLPPDFIG